MAAKSKFSEVQPDWRIVAEKVEAKGYTYQELQMLCKQLIRSLFSRQERREKIEYKLSQVYNAMNDLTQTVSKELK